MKATTSVQLLLGSIASLILTACPPKLAKLEMRVLRTELVEPPSNDPDTYTYDRVFIEIANGTPSEFTLGVGASQPSFFRLIHGTDSLYYWSDRHSIPLQISIPPNVIDTLTFTTGTQWPRGLDETEAQIRDILEDGVIETCIHDAKQSTNWTTVPKATDFRYQKVLAN